MGMSSTGMASSQTGVSSSMGMSSTGKASSQTGVSSSMGMSSAGAISTEMASSMSSTSMAASKGPRFFKYEIKITLGITANG